jgi:hypothetical protein
VQIANAFRIGRVVYVPVFAGKDGDETAVSRIKVEVAFVGIVQVGLLTSLRPESVPCNKRPFARPAKPEAEPTQMYVHTRVTAGKRPVHPPL